ncbi:cytochrome P450 [Streptomyces sp. NPDC021020]|uniref:cytochrome P450 n=1 Tax=Streptomyces sp. NPDC021020 TaxID=3365109 RepID=UPI0037A1D147
MTSSTTGTDVTLDASGGTRLYAQADELRAAGPAVRVALPEGVTAWSVTRGDVIRRLLSGDQLSKDARRSWPGYVPGAIPWLYSWVDVKSMFTSDDPDHQRLKQLISRAFTPRRIEAMRPVLQGIVTDLLDGLERREREAPGSLYDLRADFAYQVPTRLICDLFGVPDDQRPAMLDVIDRVLTMSGATQEEGQAINRDMGAAMYRLLETKRQAPGDDMTSLLLGAHEEDGDRLDENELISTLILMIGAGSETAVAMISHAIRMMIAHPEQLAAVRRDPARWTDVIEETLRLHPPIMHMPLRYATADIDLGEGAVIRTGDAVIIGFGAHGRDPGVHASADSFDIDREDKSHLTFGYGMHYCMGAPLAKLEGEVALPAFFARFPDASVEADAAALVPQPSFIGNDMSRVPIRLGAPAASRS